MSKVKGLTLSRLAGEVVILTDGNVRIAIEVLDVDRGKVRLKFDAPRNFSINREEVQDRIDEEERLKKAA